jgi:hypothetical protein
MSDDAGSNCKNNGVDVVNSDGVGELQMKQQRSLLV